jgi:hypothetical protein
VAWGFHVLVEEKGSFFFFFLLRIGGRLGEGEFC